MRLFHMSVFFLRVINDCIEYNYNAGNLLPHFSEFIPDSVKNHYQETAFFGDI